MLMSRLLGQHAIVIGAGIGGLAAAAALAGHFEGVTVLERDELGEEPAARPGTPQARLLHGLLSGGLDALGDLFPDFERDLMAAGAVQIKVASDNRVEMPGYDPFPARDFGWVSYTMSRPLLEHVMRQRVRTLPNVKLLDRCRVLELVSDGNGSVTAVRHSVIGDVRTLRGDLIIDASGRSALVHDLLEKIGVPPPEADVVGIDMTYVMATVARTGFGPDWKMAITFPDFSSSRKTGYLFPIEGSRWMALVGEPHAAMPSENPADVLNAIRDLRTSTIYDMVKDAEPVDNVRRFRFADSCWLHYEKLDGFPRGLLPLGDSISRFNPIYGQGMTMAVKEASILKALLQARADYDNPLDGLTRGYFEAIHPWIEGAWAISSIPDLALPETRGERPSDLPDMLRFRGALLRLAARDADVHRLFQSVQYLMAPRTVLRDPDLVRRVQAEMVEA
jgi:2-polyprenyl-6-methoxyphenol hydroxylase-like FAD-dependent oxidoreductase